MPLTGNFTFVLIPCDLNQPIIEIQESKSGGLEKDKLLQYTKQYFAKQKQSSIHVSKNDNNNDQQQQQQQQSLIEKITPSVNITAVTVPTKDNHYIACSLYSVNLSTSTTAANSLLPPINIRANDILTACGHTVVSTTNNTDGSNGGGNAIYGDAFCGRAYDDETQDWERMDIYVNDIDPSSEWCRMARKVGGGGGVGRTTTSSLSNIAQQISNQKNNSNNNTTPMEVIQDTSSTTSALNMYGMDGSEPVLEEWGTWTQTNDEIEIKIALPIGTTSKQCDIQFHKNTIQVQINNTTIINGTTYDPISIDDSTYTIQDGYGSTGRELCITIGKVETGRTWMYVAK
jgi:CS domain